MWDSSTESPGAAPPRALRSAGDQEPRSSSAQPGDFARTAPVGAEVGERELTLVPDAVLLTAPTTEYPVFIDPAWSVTRSRWAYATSNNETNTDYSTARVGRNPDTGGLYRSFFEFPTLASNVSLKGKHIESAYVQMKLDHSWSCGDTPSYLYSTPTINATMKASWSQMNLVTRLSSAMSHANEAGGCGVIYPDMIVNFTGSGVTNFVQSAANGNWNTVTVGFCACSANTGTGESTQDRWKKFFPADAKLIVDYDSKPGTPTSLTVHGVACAGGGIRIGSTTPKLSAVYPDADTGQTLSGSYEWVEVPSGGVGAITTSTPRKTAPPAASALANGRGTTANLSGAVSNKTYAFRLRTTDPAPYSIVSPWSGWCQFTVDTTVPTVTATLQTQPTTPGGTVQIRIESPDPLVTKFRYGWTAATTEITAQGSGPRYATVTLTVPKYGLNTLYVAAVDSTLNQGSGHVEFTAPRPSTARASWRLEQLPQVGEVEALADGAPTVGGDTPLTATGVTWSDDIRVIGGKTATFTGLSAVAATAGPVVDTTGSFSVAGWVRLGALPTTADHHAVAQQGSDTVGFALGTRLTGSPLTPRWAFLMKDTAAQSSTARAAVGGAALTAADVGRWTHLAGVYDKPAGKIRLYVDGVLAQEVDRPVTPWAATGPFVVGRGYASGAPSNPWPGSVAAVHAYDRVLVGHDFTGALASEPESGGITEPAMFTVLRVGDWDFEDAMPCYEDGGDPLLCQAPDIAFDRRLALSAGVGLGSGSRNGGIYLDGTHWVDDPGDPHYQASTQEYGRSQRLAGDPFNPTWGDDPVLRTDGSFTVSAWVHLTDRTGTRTVVSQDNPASGGYSGFDLGYRATGATTGEWVFTVRSASGSTATTTVAAPTPAVAELTGNWYQLTGVLDAGARRLRLFVNGEPAGAVALNTSWQPWQAAGPLVVGRSDQPGGFANWLHGGVDDLVVHQGAATAAAVRLQYDKQSS
ncbi:MAG TPA: LamG domain-containing protein [Pilimelia sp.]|nr:LamG domain-containing protein [Pilimelia sp.]